MRFVGLALTFILMFVGGCQTADVSDEAEQIVLTVLGEVVPLNTLLLPLYMYPAEYAFVREQPIPPDLLVCSELQVRASVATVIGQYRHILESHRWHIEQDSILPSSGLLRAEQDKRWIEIRAVQGRDLCVVSLMAEVVNLPEWIDPVIRRGAPTKRRRYTK